MRWEGACADPRARLPLYGRRASWSGAAAGASARRQHAGADRATHGRQMSVGRSIFVHDRMVDGRRFVDGRFGSVC